MPGLLTIVPTPVGNLEDITHRGVRVLSEAELILAEDTRTSQKLLQAYGITTPLAPYHMHNEHRVVDGLVERIAGGLRACLVTDAGTPGISDPGYLLVRACLDAGVEVTCLPGATAFVPALVASGLPCERFCFEGFLPNKKGRQSRILSFKEREMTTILYESPNRLIKLLQELKELLDDEEREIVVAREISKIHEQYHRGTADELLTFFEENKPLGELVVLIAPAPKEEKTHKNKYKKEN